MRNPTTLVLTILLLASATSFAAPLPEPACGSPAMETIQELTNVIVCPMTVPDGEEEEFNNDTYSFLAPITVEDGGRVEIILSDVIVGPEGTVHVQAGGTILIDASVLTAAPGTGPLILLDAGANVEVLDSDFSSVTVDVGASAASIHDNNFLLGSPAVRLTAFTGIFKDNTFERNVVGLNITGGTPEIDDVHFSSDTLGMEIYDADVNVHNIDMTNVHDGIKVRWSQGTFTMMAIDDESLPPTTGIDVQDTVGPTTISFNSIQQFGTGIFYCRADVSIFDNFFAENGEDVVSC